MKRRMSLRTACDLVPDDLPDGAYFAMAHEIAGADFGEAWHELDDSPSHKSVRCPECSKRFRTDGAYLQHARAKHGSKP